MKSDHYKNANGEQIDFTVFVHQRPNLRNNEMLSYVGITYLKEMFDGCKVNPTVTSIQMEYPERWANILELRAIPDRMSVVYPNLIKVKITTHSVYIVQCVHSQHILIDNTAGDYPEKDYKDLSVRYAEPPEGDVGLMCFGGSLKIG
jgi:hypothetical protein